MSESLAQTQQLYEQIRKAIFDGTQSVDAINDAISALKVKLINFSFANPRKNQSRDELLLIRSVLELSAEWAIHIKDIDHFERDFSQLETFYFDFNSILGESENMCLFLGLDLMRLLVQDRVADFHVALERIDLKYHSDPNVALPIRAEQYLMEGTYKRIKQEEDKLADNRFKFFFAELRTRNRKEIADCIQKSYTEIPIAEAKRILLWDNRQNFEKFMVECGWHNCVVGNEILVFKSDKDDSPAYLNDDIIDQNLQYAQELERIV